MRIRSNATRLARASVLALIGAAAWAGGVKVEAGAVAGPPAVCVPIECEGANVMIGDAPFATVSGYSADRAMTDALATLGKSGDVLVHMETIRRAVVYLNRDGGRSNQLLARLLARTAEAEADGGSAEARALAWFDAGYFVGASSQMRTEFGWEPGSAWDVTGLAWIERAVRYADEDDAPAMQFGAALVAHPAMQQSKRGVYEKHMRAAIAGAADGSMLMRNIEVHAEYWDEAIEDLRGEE